MYPSLKGEQLLNACPEAIGKLFSHANEMQVCWSSRINIETGGEDLALTRLGPVFVMELIGPLTAFMEGFPFQVLTWYGD